jgi:hypothetical protein
VSKNQRLFSGIVRVGVAICRPLLDAALLELASQVEGVLPHRLAQPGQADESSLVR